MIYEQKGQLFNGLNKCHLLVVMDIPKFIFLILLSVGKTFKLQKVFNMKVLHGVCYSLVPLYINYEAKEQQI